MKITRRTAMTRGAQAVAAGAVLSVVTYPYEHADSVLFNLVRQWRRAVTIENELGNAWFFAVEKLLPPNFRRNLDFMPSLAEYRRAFEDPDVTALRDQEDQAKSERFELERRILETPARTIGGIAAKLQIGGVKLSDLEQSVLADAERLAGRLA